MCDVVYVLFLDEFVDSVVSFGAVLDAFGCFAAAVPYVLCLYDDSSLFEVLSGWAYGVFVYAGDFGYLWVGEGFAFLERV